MPTVSAEFVAAMEDVLDLYAEAYDPQYPTVCLDEQPVVLHAQTRAAQAATAGPQGHPERRDYEYVRQGTADLFVMVEPLAGWRQVAVTERRTRTEFAEQLRYLVEDRYPDVEYVRLVVDNWNTHVPAARNATFPPERARAILQRIEFHDTPKHGSWLTMSELEISVFARGCLSRPVGDLPTLRHRVAALEAERHAAQATSDGQVTSHVARTKLAKLYPDVKTKMD